jgi:hypothetical protein
MKPKHYYRPPDTKFENVNVEKLSEVGMVGEIMKNKTVRFGPVMHKVSNDQESHYNFHVKEHYT